MRSAPAYKNTLRLSKNNPKNGPSKIERHAVSPALLAASQLRESEVLDLISGPNEYDGHIGSVTGLRATLGESGTTQMLYSVIALAFLTVEVFTRTGK